MEQKKIMPWTNIELEQKSDGLRTIIIDYLKIEPNSKIFLCTKQEMSIKLEEELRRKLVSKKKLDFFKTSIFPLVIGKFFSETNEIWLIEGPGEKKSVVIHEMLHSIQVCMEHREGICDYLTYKLSKDSTSIDENTLMDWSEIERIHGITAIKKRFLLKGDCEDF